MDINYGLLSAWGVQGKDHAALHRHVKLQEAPALMSLCGQGMPSFFINCCQCYQSIKF